MFNQSGEKNFDLWQKLDDQMKKASEEIAKKHVSTEPGAEPVSLRMWG
jgi:DNA-binding protein YbaB